MKFISLSDLPRPLPMPDLETYKMWTVVQEKNLIELSDLVDLAKKMNFKSMVFSLDIVDWGNTDWTEKK